LWLYDSEEEARKKIYSVSTRCYFAFGALVSEEVSYKIKGISSFKLVGQRGAGVALALPRIKTVPLPR